MTRNINISMQVEQETFEQAQSVLAERGMSISTAFAMFIDRIASDKQLPFEEHKLLFWEEMTKEERDRAIQEGLDDIKNGRESPVEDVFRRLKEKYGI